MSILDSNKLFEEVRIRMEWTMNELLDKTQLDNNTLRRIANRAQSPSAVTMEALTEVEPLLKTSLVFPYLDDQPMEVFSLCDDIVHSLDTLEYARAEELMTVLETCNGFDKPINRQFILSQKARLNFQKNMKQNDILPLIREGLNITGIDENNFSGKALLSQEPELLHTLALLYSRGGKMDEAIKILNDVRAGLNRVPADDRNKQKRLVYILLKLARLNRQVGNHENALSLCSEGFDVSVKQNIGALCPEFLLLKALLLHDKGEKEKERFYRLLIHAYCQFIALNKREEAQKVISLAKEKFDIRLEMYGVENLVSEQTQNLPYIRKNPVPQSGFNMLLSAFREQNMFSRKQICSGLCDVSMLSKLENDSNKVSSYYLYEALMQRIGRDDRIYRAYYASAKVFDDVKLREEISMLRRHGKYEKATELLEILAESKDCKKGIPLQFILNTRAAIYRTFNGYDTKYFAMLVEAIRITCPDFIERDIEEYPLTVVEASLINQMAVYYEGINDLFRAAKLYDSLLSNIESNWRDESLKARMYATVAFNYSSCLGLLGQRTQAMDVIKKAMEFERNHDSLTFLSGFFYNIAYIFREEGKAESECLPYLSLAYYLCESRSEYGTSQSLEIMRDHAKTHYGVEFA